MSAHGGGHRGGCPYLDTPRHAQGHRELLALAREAAKTLRSCDRHPDDAQLVLVLEGQLDELARWRDRLRAARWQGMVAS